MATGKLEEFLRKTENVARKTVAGIGPGKWDSGALERSQGGPADSALILKTKTLYRVYTENVLMLSVLTGIIGRYFEGATVYYGVGLDARTQQGNENAVMIEIVSSKEDSLQRILWLAGDLRQLGKQISVLVTRASVDTFEVTDNV